MISPVAVPAPPAPAPTLVRKPSTGRSRFLTIFTVSVVVLTLGAIVLAMFAPLLDTRTFAVPPGWDKVYDQQMSGAEVASVWNASGSCRASTSENGLFFGGGNLCEYVPSRNGALDRGFALVAEVAPAAEVDAEMLPGIRIAGNVRISFDQQGAYLVCSETCSPAGRGSGFYETGTTVGWHADALVPNTIRVLYTSDHMMEVFANDTFVTAVYVGTPYITSLEIGAASGGEALYTRLTIYTPAQ